MTETFVKNIFEQPNKTVIQKADEIIVRFLKFSNAYKTFLNDVPEELREKSLNKIKRQFERFCDELNNDLLEKDGLSVLHLTIVQDKCNGKSDNKIAKVYGLSKKQYEAILYQIIIILGNRLSWYGW